MMKKLLFIFIVFTSFLYGAEKAYAWGYGDLLVETLKVVKYMFSIGEFKDFWKVGMIISLLSAVLMMLTPNPDFLKLPKIFILSIGIYTLFIVSKIDVYVDDKADNTNSGLVKDVPWAVGWPLAFFSTLEYRIGAVYETATSIPNGMKYSDSGFFTPVSIFSQATKHKIVTPYIYQNFNNYIQECVIPDLENGYKDYKTLVNSDDVWTYMGNTSPATFMLYVDASNNTSLVACTTAYTNLNTDLQGYVGSSGAGMEFLGKSLGMLSSSVIASQLGVANQYLLGSSKTASQMLLQNAALNIFSDSFRNYTNLNGGDLNNTAFHSASASQAASAQMIVSGILGSKYIPVIKGILTAIIVGLTPLLALVMITPMGFKTLIGYIMILSWLVCWHFGDVILNHIMTTKAQSALSGYGDIKMSTKGLIDSTAMDYINMAGSMYWTIPTIALLIVTGFSLSAFASLNNAMTTKLDRTASAVGGDMGKGNMSFGNVGHNTYSANKQDASASQVMGNSMRWDDIASFNSGTQANRLNGVSSQSGTQGFGGGIGESWTNSALSKDLGKGYELGEGVQSTTAIGGGRHKATGEGTIDVKSSTGENIVANADSGNIYTKDSSGDLKLQSGKLSFIDDGKSVDVEYKDGQEFRRSITDRQGNKMEATTMENGVDKSFKWTSGQDSGTVVSGVYNARANQVSEITDAKISGTDLAKTDSGIQTFSAGQTATLLKSLDKSLMKSNTTGKDLSESTGDKKDSSLGESSSASTSGGIGASIGGIGLQAALKKDATSSTLDSMSKTFTVTDKEGKSETYSLSDREMSALQSASSSISSQSSGMNASRDMNPERIKSLVNQGLANNTSVDDTLKGVVGDKDAYHSGSINMTGNGTASVVGNNISKMQNNFGDLSGRSTELSDESQKTIDGIEGKYSLKSGSIDNAMQAINKKLENGLTTEDKTLIGGAVVAGLGAAYVGKDKIIDKLNQNKGDWDKTMDDLANSTEKVESALKNGKGGKGTEQAFKDLGLEEHAKNNGFVFNKDGSVNSESTKLKQNSIQFEREAQAKYGISAEKDLSAKDVGKKLFSEAIDEKLSKETDLRKINNLNKLKEDLESGKEISNKRMIENGFGHNLTSNSPIGVGSTVQTKDRGNFGTVQKINGDGSMEVKFVNPNTKKEATVRYEADNLTNTKNEALKGNYDFEKVGQNYVSNKQGGMATHINSGANVENNDVQGSKTGSIVKGVGLGAVAVGLGTTAYANMTPEAQKVTDTAMNFATGIGAAVIPTSLGTDADKLPVAQKETPANPFRTTQNGSSDGNFGFEKGTAGLEQTTKIWNPNDNKQTQQVEEVKDKK